MIPITLVMNKSPLTEKLSGIWKLQGKMKIFLTGKETPARISWYENKYTSITGKIPAFSHQSAFTRKKNTWVRTILTHETVRDIKEYRENNRPAVVNNQVVTNFYPVLPTPVSGSVITNIWNTEHIYQRAGSGLTAIIYSGEKISSTGKTLIEKAGEKVFGIYKDRSHTKKYRDRSNTQWNEVKLMVNSLQHRIENPVQKVHAQPVMPTQRVVYGANPKRSGAKNKSGAQVTEMDEEMETLMMSTPVGDSWYGFTDESDYMPYASHPLMPEMTERTVTMNNLFSETKNIHSILTERENSLRLSDLLVKQENIPVHSAGSYIGGNHPGKQIYMDRFCDQLVVHIAQADNKGYEQIQDEIRDSLMQIFENYD